MKNLCALLSCTVFFAVSTQATQTPYDATVRARVAKVVYSLPSPDLENFLETMDGLYSQKTDCIQKTADSPEIHLLISIINEIYEDFLKIRVQKNEEESEDELLAQKIVFAHLVLLSVYRLMYEQAEHRGLPIISRIVTPDTIETIMIESC